MQFKREKLSLVLLLFFFIGFQQGYCQSRTVGVKAGIQGAWLGGDAENVVPKVGYHAGFFFTQPIGKLAIQPELYYSFQGTGFKEGSDKLNLHYLTFPLLIQIEKEKYFFVFGPAVAVLAGARLKQDEDRNHPGMLYVWNPEEDMINVTSQLSNVDFSMVLGLGAKINSGLAAELRVNYGISDAMDSFWSEDYNYPNRLLQLTLSKTLKNE